MKCPSSICLVCGEAMDECSLDDAIDTLREHTANDPNPVSMITLGDEQRHDLSVVVLRSQEVIEMFRQWAERNKIYDRAQDIDGSMRQPEHVERTVSPPGLYCAKHRIIAKCPVNCPVRIAFENDG